MKKCISTDTITTQRDTLPGNLQSEVVNYSLWMRREGFSPTTIGFRTRTVRRMAQQLGTLLDGDKVKDWVAGLPVCGGTELAMFKAYACYANSKGLSFQIPKVQNVEAPLPFIPLENELDVLISGAGKKLASFLLLLKEVGCRAGEALRIEWTNIDTEASTVNLRAEKGSRNRQAKVSQKLVAMLMRLHKRNKYVFSSPTGANKLTTLTSNLFAVRARQAKKLKNPRLLGIHFHTYRH